MATASEDVERAEKGHGSVNNTDVRRISTRGVLTEQRHMLKELQHGCDNSDKGCCSSNITDVATTQNSGVLTVSTQMNQNKNKNMTSDENKVDDCNSILVFKEITQVRQHQHSTA
jgi:hypothetical protein